MSKNYSQTIRGKIKYSGSVDYPASETPGSVVYSGSEDVIIVVNVDGDSFAKGVDSCNRSIDLLTDSVVATKVAQIKSKALNAKALGDTIIKGFFDYVGADISQKMTSLNSEKDALLMQLMSQREAVEKQKDQMQEDYSRISKRYLKLFADLDAEVSNRIAVLDGPTFRFVKTSQEVVERQSTSELLSIAAISAGENIRMETLLTSSRIKSLANELVDKARAYLGGTRRLANSIDRMISGGSDAGEVCVPVVYVETTVDAEHRTNNVYTPSSDPSGEEPVDMDKEAIATHFMSQDLEWEPMDEETHAKLISYINADIREGNLDDRVQSVLQNLIHNQSIETIKG